MAEFQEVFITKRTQDGINNYEANNSYVVADEVAKQLVEKGSAELINFPTINTIREQADSIADDYKKRLDELKKTPRYADNPAERSFQIDLLEQETAYKIAEHERNIKAELQAIRIDSASRALSTNSSPEEIASAKQEAESIITQILINNDPSSVYELLELKIGTMTDTDKIEVLKRFDEVKARATSNDKAILERIERGLRSINNEHLRALQHIKALENSGVVASQKYKTAKLIQSRRNGDGIL